MEACAACAAILPFRMFKSFRMTMHCFIDLLTFVVSTILFSPCLDLHNAADFLAFPLLLYSNSFGALCFLVFLSGLFLLT
jgi:hypothetical protein